MIEEGRSKEGRKRRLLRPRSLSSQLVLWFQVLFDVRQVMSVHMGKRCMHMQQAILQGDVELLQKLLAGQWRNPRGDGIFILSLKALLTVINAPEVESVNHFDFTHWWGGGCYAHVMHRQGAM